MVVRGYVNWDGAKRWGFPALALMLAACTPTVKIEAPEKPIVINLNVKIEQEVRIRVERDIDDLLRENDDLF
ncbi:MAG: YnbE family lipoprotein [Alphaproteobacteria bacterium]